MIEKRSKGEIINLLQAYNLGKNIEEKWKDYSKAKKIIFGGQFIDCDIYNKQISWICDYLRI